MRKFTFLVAAVVLSLSLSAQKQVRETKFKKGPKVTQTFNSTSPKALQGVLNYDNGEIGFGLGSTSAHTIEPYHQFPASMITSFVGKNITHIKVGMDDPSGYSKMVVRIKLDSLNTTPVFEEEMDAGDLVAGMNLFALTTAYEIPADKDLFVGVYLESSGGYGIAVDTDPTPAPEYSSLLVWNGAFQGSIAGSYGDFIIQALITDDGNTDGDLKDLAIIDANPTTEDCTLSSTETIAVTLKNLGDLKINEKFNLTVEINDSPITMQVSPTGFDAGTEMVVNMDSWDMSAFGTYNMSVSHDWDDHVIFNNILNKTISTGDAKITIDLTTDDWASETSWALFDDGGNIIAANGSLSDATNYVTDICVNSTGCYTWTIFDEYGDGLAEGPGSFTIYYNGVEVGSSPTNGDFGTEFSVFGLGDGCPENDIVLTNIDLPNEAEPGEIEIKGTIQNSGTQILTSFDVVYVVGDYTSSTYTVSGISIATGESYDFTHDVAYDFIEGEYDIEVTVSNPNGVADENLDDNTQTHHMIVSPNLFERKQLFEHFTSSTCGPCASYTPTADALQAANEGKYCLIRYQVSWPGAGDPYQTQMAADRVDYYGVSGVPSVYRNGTYDMDVSQAVFDEYAALKSVINLDVTATYLANNVSIEAKVNSVANIDAGLKLHLVVVENQTEGNVGTNGETKFRNVMMTMLPTSAGTTLESIAANDTKTINVAKDMSTTFVEEMNDLSVVAFVQNDATKEVIQSVIVPVNLENGINTTKEDYFNIYPNPFTNTITITNLKNASEIVLSNVLGQTISKVKVNGLSQVISTSELENGIYLITVIDNNGKSSTVRVVKQ